MQGSTKLGNFDTGRDSHSGLELLDYIIYHREGFAKAVDMLNKLDKVEDGRLLALRL